MISHENLPVVASLLTDYRFERLMQDVENARQNALGKVLTCRPEDLPQARANLVALTNFISAVNSAPDQAKEADRLNDLANTGSPDRVT